MFKWLATVAKAVNCRTFVSEILQSRNLFYFTADSIKADSAKNAIIYSKKLCHAGQKILDEKSTEICMTDRLEICQMIVPRDGSIESVLLVDLDPRATTFRHTSVSKSLLPGPPLSRILRRIEPRNKYVLACASWHVAVTLDPIELLGLKHLIVD
jgi:hypothetical protein